MGAARRTAPDRRRRCLQLQDNVRKRWPGGRLAKPPRWKLAAERRVLPKTDLLAAYTVAEIHSPALGSGREGQNLRGGSAAGGVRRRSREGERGVEGVSRSETKEICADSFFCGRSDVTDRIGIEACKFRKLSVSGCFGWLFSASTGSSRKQLNSPYGVPTKSSSERHGLGAARAERWPAAGA